MGSHVRGVTELALCTVPALVAPIMIVQYLVGDYRAHPYTMGGKYFPDGGFLFDLHELWRAGHDVVLGHSPYPFVYPAPAAILMAPFGALPQNVLSTPFVPAASTATESVPLDTPHRMNPVPRYTPIGWPVIAIWLLKSPIFTYCRPAGSF